MLTLRSDSLECAFVCVASTGSDVSVRAHKARVLKEEELDFEGGFPERGLGTLPKS